eukprot:1160558-Pelagomonas_calceolata.AAC.7
MKEGNELVVVLTLKTLMPEGLMLLPGLLGKQKASELQQLIRPCFLFLTWLGSRVLPGLLGKRAPVRGAAADTSLFSVSYPAWQQGPPWPS